RSRAAMRLCRHLRGEVGQDRTPRPDPHRMVGAAATASYRVFEPRFSPLADDHSVTCNEQGRFRQWTAQLRGRASACRSLALLLALCDGGGGATAGRTAGLPGEK